ncbi:hypothetical protein J437_LFUL007405 [Ladona fulva]|uniref:CCHC-type domain-containing protein n=1 Tax=Ladona fulva TaxID=123851 RepID=A0A8K0K543_LADFU|nr:hypothetical protein J437_LFUL007405 [Ladona fulva]
MAFLPFTTSYDLRFPVSETNPFRNFSDPSASVNVITDDSPPATSTANSDSHGNSPAAPGPIGNQIYFIPCFSGDDETMVEKFLESVQLTSQLSAWSEQQTLCVVRLRLSGSAAEYVHANPHILDSYELFTTSLKRRFTSKISPITIERLFSSCIQSTLESVSVYATRLRKLGRQLREISYEPQSAATSAMIEHRLLSQFLVGLREDIGRFVLVRNPKTLLEAEDFAILEEANARNYSNKYLDVRTMQSFLTSNDLQNSQSVFPANFNKPFSTINREINAVQTTQQRPLPIPTAGAPRNSDRKCYRCGRTDHIARFCRSKPQNCYNCGKANHFSRDCPLLICKQSGHRPIYCPQKESTPVQGNSITPTARSGTN